MAADLDDVVRVLEQIKVELDFTTNGAAAKVILDQLKKIESRLSAIEDEIINLK